MQLQIIVSCMLLLEAYRCVVDNLMTQRVKQASIMTTKNLSLLKIVANSLLMLLI